MADVGAVVGEPIKQKWNGLAQHVASVVLSNTDTVVLTLFSTLQNVSVYAVYFLVVDGIKRLTTSITTGMQALLGNMYANNEAEALNETFSFLEWLLHTVTVFLFTCTAILIVPFIRVYTNNITDTNYIVPTFAAIITFAQASYCLRLPYNMMVLAAGHFKQTQLSALIEMMLNITVSIALVIKYGLIGVGIGTAVAMAYRTTYLAWYLKNNILNRSFVFFLRQVGVDILTAAIVVFASRYVREDVQSYSEWIKYALLIAAVCFGTVAIINSILFPKMVGRVVRGLVSRFKRK